MREPLFALWVSDLPDQPDGYITEMKVEQPVPGVYLMGGPSTTTDPKKAVLATLSKWRQVTSSSYNAVGPLLSSDQLSEAEELMRDMKFVPASELGR